jgi:hypothetical protein
MTAYGASMFVGGDNNEYPSFAFYESIDDKPDKFILDAAFFSINGLWDEFFGYQAGKPDQKTIVADRLLSFYDRYQEMLAKDPSYEKQSRFCLVMTMAHIAMSNEGGSSQGQIDENLSIANQWLEKALLCDDLGYSEKYIAALLLVSFYDLQAYGLAYEARIEAEKNDYVIDPNYSTFDERYVPEFDFDFLQRNITKAYDLIGVGSTGSTGDGNYSMPPYIKEGRTYLPVREICEYLAADVSWNATTRKITINRDITTVILTVDSKTAIINGIETPLDCAPEIVDGRTFLPIRPVAEALGFSTTWKAEERRVIIKPFDERITPEQETILKAINPDTQRFYFPNVDPPFYASSGLAARTSLRNTLLADWSIRDRASSLEIIEQLKQEGIAADNIAKNSGTLDMETLAKSYSKLTSVSSKAYLCGFISYAEYNDICLSIIN